MRLYHFLESKWAIEGIRNRRLKISRIDRLNDPFEFLAAAIGGKDLRHAMRRTLKKLADNHGIICFCSDWKNPVMWAHYGDRHKGICLGFDVQAPSDALVKLDYVPHRLKAPDRMLATTAEWHAFFMKMSSLKYEQWQYEDEYRLHVDFNDPPIDGKDYFDFGKEMVLREVIVGAECEATRADVRAALGTLSSKVDAFKARAGFQNFEMVRNKGNAAWK